MRAMWSTPALLAILVCQLNAAGAGRLQREQLSRDQAERRLAALTTEASASMYIWTDKYVYRPGEQLTLRWTVTPNEDFYPYTIFAYRINNQTGVKTFLPGGTESLTDAYGQTMEQGFRIGRLEAASKSVLVGANGSLVNSPLGVPNELGMHTIVVQLRDYSGTRVLKSAYAKIGVVDGEETLSGNIDGNRELVNTKMYRLSGVVYVRNNATLTIQPGTFIVGQPGSTPPSTLVITRNGRINANGTRSRPIVFTSSRPFGERQRGDWGGLYILGAAPTNQPDAGRDAEGLPPTDDTKYGGTNAEHNCGTMRYVRVEFAGVALNANAEVNSFGWGSCGTQTVSEYLQAHYGGDDSFEWFGGTNNARYLVGTYGDDDYIDAQLGWTGKVQYVLAVAGPDAGSRGIEADNNENGFTLTPFTRFTLFNATFVGNGRAGTEDSSVGALLRRGVQGSINNAIFTNFGTTGIQVSDPPTFTGLEANNLTANGVILWDNGKLTNAANTLQGQVHADTLTFAQGTRGTGRQFSAVNPQLTRPLGYSGGDWRPQATSPALQANYIQPPDDGFFDQSANFVGAIGYQDWTEEWTNFLLEEDLRP